MSRRAQLAADWAASDCGDIAAYLGPNAERFRRVYERGRERVLEKGVGNVAGWSWPALVFGFAWFLYRRQWAVGALLLILPLLAAYFLENGGASTGVAIVMAIYAKSFIVQDAVTRVARAKAGGASAADLAAAGGVSVPGGIVGGILWTLAVAGALLTLLG